MLPAFSLCFLNIPCTLWRQSHDSRQQTELQRNNGFWHSAWFFSLSLNLHSPVLHFPGARGNLPKWHNLNWSTTGSLIPFHVAELKAIAIMFFFTLKVFLICACKSTRGKQRVPFLHASLASLLIGERPFSLPSWSRLFFFPYDPNVLFSNKLTGVCWPQEIMHLK